MGGWMGVEGKERRRTALIFMGGLTERYLGGNRLIGAPSLLLNVPPWRQTFGPVPISQYIPSALLQLILISHPNKQTMDRRPCRPQASTGRGRSLR